MGFVFFSRSQTNRDQDVAMASLLSLLRSNSLSDADKSNGIHKLIPSEARGKDVQTILGPGEWHRFHGPYLDLAKTESTNSASKTPDDFWKLQSGTSISNQSVDFWTLQYPIEPDQNLWIFLKPQPGLLPSEFLFDHAVLVKSTKLTNAPFLKDNVGSPGAGK
jgi:hypothetical protein